MSARRGRDRVVRSCRTRSAGRDRRSARARSRRCASGVPCTLNASTISSVMSELIVGPVARLRQPVELGLQVAPAVHVEDRPCTRASSRRTRGADASRRDRAASCSSVSADDGHERERDLDVGERFDPRAPRRVRARESSSSRSERSVPNGCTMKPSATSPAISVMCGPDAGEEDARQAVGARAGIEERRHQRVPVELAAEIERRAFVPAWPRSRGSRARARACARRAATTASRTASRCAA